MKDFKEGLGIVTEIQEIDPNLDDLARTNTHYNFALLINKTVIGFFANSKTTVNIV